MIIKVIASSSSGNCTYIHDGRTSLLLDAGIPYKKIWSALHFKVDADAALITHQHLDHCRAVPDLAKWATDVYAPPEVLEALGLQGHHRCKSISSGVDDEGNIVKKIVVGSFTIVPFDCAHDVPNVGFYIHSSHTGENLLYFTDSFYLRHKFKDLHYILAEANYSSDILDENVRDGKIPAILKGRVVSSHMELDTLLNMLRVNDLSKVKRIYLLHLSDANSNAEEFKRRVAEETGCEVYVG